MTTAFADLGIPSEVLAALTQLGFETPLDIQTLTIPDAMAGRDVCGRAMTGSGKTLAFGIPLAALVGRARPHYPRGLVLAPTRELAEQIQREVQPLARSRGRSVASIYGGVGYGPQRKALRQGVDILVACPGRLADLIQQGDVHLDEVDIVVIDEADRMADMGFLPEVRRLLDQTAKERQTVLYSATLDDDVAVITRNYQRNPAYHQVGNVEPDVHSAQHHFWRVQKQDRHALAQRVIRATGRTIVFSRTRHGADNIARKLNRAGVGAAAIHGKRSQNQRNRALAAFSRGDVQALVATDVAARGIHVDGVDCVLHFDIPGDEKTYLHRSGRTARAGATGVVVSLVHDEQVVDSCAMQSALGLTGYHGIPAPERLVGPDGSPIKAAAAPESQSGPCPEKRTNGSNGGNRGNGGSGGSGGTGGGRHPGRSGGGKSRNQRNQRRRRPSRNGRRRGSQGAVRQTNSRGS